VCVAQGEWYHSADLPDDLRQPGGRRGPRHPRDRGDIRHLGHGQDGRESTQVTQSLTVLFNVVEAKKNGLEGRGWLIIPETGD
jgi:hypothetical protein